MGITLTCNPSPLCTLSANKKEVMGCHHHREQHCTLRFLLAILLAEIIFTSNLH